MVDRNTKHLQKQKPIQIPLLRLRGTTKMITNPKLLKEIAKLIDNNIPDDSNPYNAGKWDGIVATLELLTGTKIQ